MDMQLPNQMWNYGMYVLMYIAHHAIVNNVC